MTPTTTTMPPTTMTVTIVTTTTNGPPRGYPNADILKELAQFGRKKLDDGRWTGLPAPGTGPDIPSESPPRNDGIGPRHPEREPPGNNAIGPGIPSESLPGINAIGPPMPSESTPRNNGIGRGTGRGARRTRNSTIRTMQNASGSRKNNFTTRSRATVAETIPGEKD